MGFEKNVMKKKNCIFFKNKKKGIKFILSQTSQLKIRYNTGMIGSALLVKGHGTNNDVICLIL